MQEQQPKPKPKRATTAFALSLTASILIIVQGIVRFVRAEWVIEPGMDEFRRRIFGEIALTVLGLTAIAFGAIILIGAILLYQPGNEVAGAALVLAFSILSFLVGGGFLIGMILGIVGGALALAKI